MAAAQKQPNPPISQVLAAVREVSAMSVKGYRVPVPHRQKPDGSSVSAIDLQVQRQLAQRLRALTPAAGFICEERSPERVPNADSTWILDPIDGTHNLLRGIPHFAVSLALMAEGRLQLAVVHNPAIDETFYAVRGGGAFLNGEGIQVSETPDLRDALVALGFPHERALTSEQLEALVRVAPHCRDVRRQGSAALDLCYVACGRVDAYFELVLQPWDHAAGQLIVAEAGGSVTDWSGARVAPGASSSVVATNGHLHRALMALLD